MRRLLTYMLALVVLVASLVIGAIAADLPFWRRALQLPLPQDTLYLPVAQIGADTGATRGQAPTGAATAPPTATERAALERVITHVRAAGSRALLAMRGGVPVLSRYFSADDEHSLLPAGMISRPVLAMAVGVAIAEQRIDSLDLPVSRYLPEWEDDLRGRITLRQLLEDTSGLESGGAGRHLLRRAPWDDLRALPRFATAKGVRLLLGNDFAYTALRFELQHEPGGFYNESPANPQLAAVILERATRTPYETYVQDHLWRPLGAGRAELTLDRRSGMPAAHCCWRASAVDMLRVLDLLANGGNRDGRQIVPANWIGEMTRASRVNADSGLQVKRLSVGGTLAVTGSDEDGGTFWVFPERQLTILNVVNEQGWSPPELGAVLLPLLTGGAGSK
jgi:CubicO group peptidase (beta-lactamase class C family)